MLDRRRLCRTGGSAAEGGMVELELSTSDLSYGLHRVSFRSRDEAGRWSAPFSRYFVKAEPSLANNRIEAYEYWFNNGKTHGWKSPRPILLRRMILGWT